MAQFHVFFWPESTQNAIPSIYVLFLYPSIYINKPLGTLSFCSNINFLLNIVKYSKASAAGNHVCLSGPLSVQKPETRRHNLFSAPGYISALGLLLLKYWLHLHLVKYSNVLQDALCLSLASESSNGSSQLQCSLSMPLNLHKSTPRPPSFCFYISNLRFLQMSKNMATSAHVCLWPVCSNHLDARVCFLLLGPEHVSSSANISKSVLDLVEYLKDPCSIRCVLWPLGVQNHRESSWCSFSLRLSIHHRLGISVLKFFKLLPQYSKSWRHYQISVFWPLGFQNTRCTEGTCLFSAPRLVSVCLNISKSYFTFSHVPRTHVLSKCLLLWSLSARKRLHTITCALVSGPWQYRSPQIS